MTMRRSAYTLLEVLLATSIAVLLLGALYVAVDVQLNYAQAGRDRVEQNTLARSIFARMSSDASQVVSLSDPARFRVQSSGSSGSSGGTSGTGGTTGNTGTSGAGATGGATSGSGMSGSTGSSTDDGSSTTTTTTIIVPLGVQGDSTTLNMWVSKSPRENLTADQSGGQPVVSDLWRISWWLLGDAGSATGLARQEIKIVTSDDANNLPPNIENADSFNLAPEVKSIKFEYYDGTDWQDEWDSTELGADNLTPKGSPVAIRVTMDLARLDLPDQPTKTYTRVLVLPTANGTTTFQSVNQPPTSSGTGSGTTSGM
jgi:hypothetical protein